MAIEPVLTSNCYSPTEVYTPPIGRVPVLGKVRAQIDQLRVSIADSINQMKNRDAAAADAALKTLAENALLAQKTATELAQTSNVIPTTIGINSTGVDRVTMSKDLNGVVSTVGVIGKQMALFAKQTDGFDRDAEQKLAKMMVDTWSVRMTTDGAPTGGAGLDDAEIRVVLDKARAGITIAPATSV